MSKPITILKSNLLRIVIPNQSKNKLGIYENEVGMLANVYILHNYLLA